MAPPPAPVVDEVTVTNARAAIAEAWLAMKEWRHTADAEAELVFPHEPLPSLDFTKGGNAIITSEEHFAREPLTGEARFQIVHLADDPWRISRLDRDSVFDSERELARTYAFKRDEANRHLAGAKYVLFVRGVSTPAELDVWNAKVITPARFDGVALLYALSPAKLVDGFPLRLESDPQQKLDKKGSRQSEMDKVMLALEAKGREVVWETLRKRTPALKAPAVYYLEVGEK